MATKNIAINETKNAAQQQVNNNNSEAIVKQVDVIGLMNGLKANGHAKLSDYATPIEDENPAIEDAQAEEIESVSVGEMTIDAIQPVMVPVEGSEYQVKGDDGKQVTFESVAPNIGSEAAEPVENTGRAKIVVAGVPKPTEKPKPQMPKRDASGRFLKKGEQPQAEEKPTEPKFQYVTYDVKKVNKQTQKEYTVTGSKIVGFELTDPIYLAGPAFNGAISTETVGDKQVGALRFSHKWTPAVKDVCDLLNSGKATLEGCVAIINGAKAERSERIQNRIAQRAERKAQREARKAQEAAQEATQEAEPAPAMSDDDRKMFDLFKRFMQNDPEVVAMVNAKKAA